MTDIEQIIEDVVRLRKDLGLTAEQVGIKAGISISSIRSFECGGIMPSIRFLEKIALALDQSLKIEFRPRGKHEPKVQPPLTKSGKTGIEIFAGKKKLKPEFEVDCPE